MTVLAPTPRPHRSRMVPTIRPQPPACPTVSAVVGIPALNEERFIGRVVNEVLAQGFECLVVDDGSTDRTSEIARRAGAGVIRHPFTLGQGAALQTAIDWALSHGADVIVTFDGDGQHRAADIPRLIDALAACDADFALGSRFLGSAINLPVGRRRLLRAATWFTRLTTGLSVTDTHNGLRAMTRRGAAAIHLRLNGMAHASEILHQVAASGLRWVEVPVTVEYNHETLVKGQHFGGFVAILFDLLMGGLDR